MSCKNCRSMQQWECPAEINIHPPAGIRNLDKPTVLAFPKLSVCPVCGFVEFALDDAQLADLTGIYDQPFRFTDVR